MKEAGIQISDDPGSSLPEHECNKTAELCLQESDHKRLAEVGCSAVFEPTSLYASGDQTCLS